MLELARESDLEAINRIALQVHERHVSWRPDIYCHTDCIFPMDYLLECIQEKCLFVAKLENAVVGFLLFRFWEMKGPGNVPRKVLQLDSIGVEETLQHQGIGKQMMAELRALAKAFGCTDIQLSVYPQNDEAVSFYQKCGFTIRNINMQRKV